MLVLVFITYFFFFFFLYSLQKNELSQDPFEYRNIILPKGVRHRCQMHLQQALSNNHNSLLSCCLQMLFSYISKYCSLFTRHWGHLLTHIPLNLQTLTSVYRVKKTPSNNKKSKNNIVHPVLHLPFQTHSFHLNLKAVQKKTLIFSPLTGWQIFSVMHDFLGDKTLLNCF